MAPSPSADFTLDQNDIEVLLDLADAAIVAALAGDPPTLPLLESLPPSLQRCSGAFVTLTVDGRLNGCIGHIEGVDPLGHAIPRLALSAAFADPRLPSLQPSDYPHLTIAVSLLSPLSPIPANSPAELLATLRPGHDGLVITAGSRRALFLPSVWKELPDPEGFVDHLWLKAGLTPRTWPAGMRTFRFVSLYHERRAGTGRPGSECGGFPARGA